MYTTVLDISTCCLHSSAIRQCRHIEVLIFDVEARMPLRARNLVANRRPIAVACKIYERDIRNQHVRCSREAPIVA